MEYICFVKNASAAENAIRSDFDLAAKQSITVKDAKSLLGKEGNFIYIQGNDEGVEKCKQILSEFVEECPEEDLKKAKEKIKEENEKAACGFGSIFK